MYCLELTQRMILKGDIPGTALVLLKNIRSRLLGQHSLIFRMTASELQHCELSIKVADYEIREVSSWDMVDETMKQTFREYKQDVWWNTESMLKKGSCLWIGYLRGELACILWTTPGDKMDSYFFPLASQCVVISHCVTLQPYRGLGLYPASLAYLVNVLASRNIYSFYIHCADWNVASIKAIKRVGFKLLGRGIARRNGRLTWYPNSCSNFEQSKNETEASASIKA